MINNVILMTKVPIHGYIKKRLSREIGNCNSKRFTLLNIESIKKKLNNKKVFNFYLYLTPTKKFRSFSFNFSNNIFLQKGANLGDKIWHLKCLFKSRFVLVGSDIPEINLESIIHAFKVLKKSDIVVGPTYDNGFWLIGFSNKKTIRNPFKGIRWSSAHTLGDLLKNAKENSISINFCKKLRDIDIIDDYCDYINKV